MCRLLRLKQLLDLSHLAGRGWAGVRWHEGGWSEGGFRSERGVQPCERRVLIFFLPQLTLQSSVQKHKPVYKLKVLFEAPSGQKWEDKEVEGKFMEWFNQSGYLQDAKLKKWLASNIDVVGRADPQSKAVVKEVLLGDDIGLGEKAVQSKGSATDGRSSVKDRRTKNKG